MVRAVKGSRRSTPLAAFIAAAALVLGASAASSHAAAGPTRAVRSAGCGPRGASTLVEGARIRVYAVIGRSHDSGRAVPLLFGCLEPNGRPRLLGSARSGTQVYRHKALPFANVRTLRMHAPWVAYAAISSGVDTWSLAVRVRNLRTNARRNCPIAVTRAPERGPSLTGIEVSGGGAVAWIGTRDSQRQVVSCTAAGEQILDEGLGIALHSLTLRGSLLSWRDGGEAHLARLTR